MADTQLATVGGGCFWCIEAVFQDLRGVHTVTSGYAGGEQPNPSYEQVCTGRSGHAEVVQVAYDPEEIGYRDLLEVFFAAHDPTQLNRQGNDIGPQYRSVIFYHDDEQRRTAEALMAELQRSGEVAGEIVTELSPYEAFYPAEGYHQDFFASNPRQPYCQLIIAPKLKKVRERFAERVR
jgi:peptide-methionine (S)-S-oxide reductase